MNGFFHCHSMRLAGFLMMRGFVLLNMEPDKNSRRNVFVFNQSESLQEAIEKYKKAK